MPSPGSERRLAAIMFTDIVGSTAATARSEAAGLELRDRHRRLVQAQVERYHGRFIEAPGDECLSTFESAVDAVHAALAIQQGLEADTELRVRIGLHLGETVFRREEVFGDGVNIAARVRQLAEPGQALVTAEVARAVQNQPNVDTSPRGEHTFKGVEHPVAVYSVSGTAAEPSPTRVRSEPGKARGRWLITGIAGVLVVGVAMAAWIYQRAATATPIRSIAVLPLENLSGDREQEYFADGMTEAVISEFARIRSLPVISRTSVMQYKRARKPLPEIAEELGVEWVLEGTVIRDRERVRITVQLIDARNDLHLWTEQYDRELSDVLGLYSEVAGSVAREVGAVLRPEEEAMLATSRSVDSAAYDAYLRVLQLMGPLQLISVWGPTAIEQLQRVVELDPDFAEAWAMLALTRAVLGTVGLNLGFRSEFPKARVAAERALELDGRLGRAHTVLGMVRFHYDWDFPGARRAFQRAKQLSPSDPVVLDNYILYLLQVEGRNEEALDLSERLLRVAPLDLIWRVQRVRHLFYSRHYERALEEVERLRELAPDFVDGELTTLYFKLGRLEEAHRAWVAFLQRCGPPCDGQREAVERGWAAGGWVGSWRALLEVVTDIEGFSPNLIAQVYALIGESDEALTWLERSYREHEPVMINVKMHPAWDPLRSDPRFQDLLRRIGFPEE